MLQLSMFLKDVDSTLMCCMNIVRIFLTFFLVVFTVSHLQKYLMARYRHPLAVDVKRDPADNTIGHLYSHAAFIILSIEQTKERLLVSKQLTTFARRGCRVPIKLLRTFSHLSSLVSIVPLGTIPDGGDNAASQ